MLRRILDGVLAGILIGIGGSVFLACGNRYVGAVMFSVALLCICYKGYALFTGRVGFLPENHTKGAWEVLMLALLGNTLGAGAVGIVVRYAIPASGEAAEILCAGKLEGQNFLQTFLRAVLCGILMYLAVSIFRDKKTPLGVLFCIPTFILAGFEHSIADIFYFSAAAEFAPRAWLYLLLVILGNAVGGVLLPMLGAVGTGQRRLSKIRSKAEGEEESVAASATPPTDEPTDGSGESGDPV